MDCGREEALLVFDDLHGGLENHTRISGVSGRVAGGEVLGVLGPKGSGKLTLLTALSGRLPDCVDDITVDGVPPGVGVARMVPRTDRMLLTLTVRESLRYAFYLGQPSSQSEEERNAAEEQVVDIFVLNNFLDALVQFTPDAVRKRVAIACASISRPALLVLDEPLKDSDYESARDIMKAVIPLHVLPDHCGYVP